MPDKQHEATADTTMPDRDTDRVCEAWNDVNAADTIAIGVR